MTLRTRYRGRVSALSLSFRLEKKKKNGWLPDGRRALLVGCRVTADCLVALCLMDKAFRDCHPLPRTHSAGAQSEGNGGLTWLFKLARAQGPLCKWRQRTAKAEGGCYHIKGLRRVKVEMWSLVSDKEEKQESLLKQALSENTMAMAS